MVPQRRFWNDAKILIALVYIFTFIGFIGLSIPNFLLALILLFLGNKYLGISVGGFLSISYIGAPMSWGKILDFLSHFIVPVVVIGTAGTAYEDPCF